MSFKPAILSNAIERWTAWRNAVLGSPGFQRFAARSWLTRGVARRRARRLFDLVAGFVYSQTLAACVATGLLDRLAGPPVALADLAEHIDLPPAAALRLLRAAAALDLVQPLRGERWTLGQAGAALCGNGGIAEMVAHHALLYADLADPVTLLRRGGGGGALAGFWAYAGDPGMGDAGQVAAYSRLMAASQPLVAQQVLDAYPFARHRRMLDVGGGEGRFVESVAARVPRLALALFDLPAVAERAESRLDGIGLGSRVRVHAGSFLADPLPPGHDLMTLVRVLHDHDDGPALLLLRAIHAALPPGGRLLIAEPMAGTRGSLPAGDAYFGLYLLAMGSGRPRTSREIHALLNAARFSRSRTLRTAMPLTCRAIVATR